jgi:RNA polymerase sigma factor for flagellar operon FliA
MVTRARELPPQQEAELWTEWRMQGKDSARDELIEHYLDYARIIAAKLYRTRYNDECEFGDYMQFATLGMLEAMETFSLDREVTFRTFASRRIHGAVLDGIHAHCESHRQISARKVLLADRTQALAEGNAAPETSTDTFLGLVEVAIGLALGYMLDGSAMYQEGEAAAREQGYERLEMRQLQQKVVQLIDTLPTRERAVIRSHYFNQIAFQDIARTFGVSKARVCQLHFQALDRLHSAMVNIGVTDIAA